MAPVGHGLTQLQQEARKRFVGRRFGRLVTVSFHSRANGSSKWLCRCDCGQECIVRSGELGRSTNSCGCLRREVSSARNATEKRTHGMGGTPTYQSWVSMKQRCLNPNHPWRKNYGGRGITVCDRWRDSFEQFYADMGERPSLAHSLERIDNDGNYEPGNCKWGTKSEQSRNRRRFHVRHRKYGPRNERGQFV